MIDFHQIKHAVGALIHDHVNIVNLIGGTTLAALKPLQYINEISIVAREITHVVGLGTATFLCAYNAVKFFKELKKK